MESLMHELGASSTTNKGEDTDGGERMLAWKGILEEINGIVLIQYTSVVIDIEKSSFDVPACRPNHD